MLDIFTAPLSCGAFFMVDLLTFFPENPIMESSSEERNGNDGI
jgi:hypothetical protein